MKRREFIILVGGAAATVAWLPLARAQQAERMRRIGVLYRFGCRRSARQSHHRRFSAGACSNWAGLTVATLKIDYRWGAGNAEDMRKHAAELVTLTPDVMLATGGTSVGPLLQATRTVPIVFANVPDPVGSGFVESLSRPGGNATGFVQFEYNLSGKWLEMLKQIAPGVTKRCDTLGSHHTRRDRPVRRHPVCGAIARRGGARDQCSRCC